MSNVKLIRALRCKTNNVNDCTMCAYHNACYDGTLENIAADVLEADEKFHAELIKNIEHWKKQVIRLRAQLPKEGEWLEDDTTYCGADLANYKCSLCGKIGGTWRRGLKQDKLPPYCPNCGSKMKTVTDCHTLDER